MIIRPGANHIDKRRLLVPRDYLRDPFAFGMSLDAARCVPPGGDGPSAEIAWIQHGLVAAWRANREQPSGAWLGRRFGFSRQTWSRSALGQRWMGDAVMAAAIYALRFPAQRSAVTNDTTSAGRGVARLPRPGA